MHLRLAFTVSIVSCDRISIILPQGKRFTVATDSKDSTPLWVTHAFTETSQPRRAKSMYVTTPPGFEQASMEISKASSLDAQCPLKHSTPNAPMATKDTNPADRLPRARVATTADLGRRSLDLTDVLQGSVSAPSGTTTRDAMHDSSSRRVTMPAFPHASLSQPTPGPIVSTSPDSMLSFQKEVSFDNSVSSIEKDVKSKVVSMSGSFDKSGNLERSSSPEILPRASIAMDTETSSKAANSETSAEMSRQRSGLSLSGTFQSRKGESPKHKKKSPVSTPAPPVEEMEDTEDIVKSFEEAIAASPTVSSARVIVTDSPISGSDMDASTLQTPQWIRDAAARRKTRMLEGMCVECVRSAVRVRK